MPLSRVTFADARADTVADRELGERIIERLTSVLDEQSREVLRLRYDEDLVQCEIAARTGTSQMYVSRLLRGSLQQLQAHAA